MTLVDLRPNCPPELCALDPSDPYHALPLSPSRLWVFTTIRSLPPHASSALTPSHMQPSSQAGGDDHVGNPARQWPQIWLGYRLCDGGRGEGGLSTSSQSPAPPPPPPEAGAGCKGWSGHNLSWFVVVERGVVRGGRSGEVALRSLAPQSYVSCLIRGVV